MLQCCYLYFGFLPNSAQYHNTISWVGRDRRWAETCLIVVCVLLAIFWFLLKCRSSILSVSSEVDKVFCSILPCFHSDFESWKASIQRFLRSSINLSTVKSSRIFILTVFLIVGIFTVLPAWGYKFEFTCVIPNSFSVRQF